LGGFFFAKQSRQVEAPMLEKRSHSANHDHASFQVLTSVQIAKPEDYGMIECTEGWSALNRLCWAHLFAAFCLGFTTLAVAQQNHQVSPTLLPKAATKTGEGEYSAWVKICTSDEQHKQVCLVKYEALDPKTGGVLVSVAVRTREVKREHHLLVNVPTAYSLAMPAGVRIKIDNEEPTSLQYTVCLPTNCQVETELTKQLLESMRKGNLMLVAAINVQQNAVTFQVPLNGFSKTLNGAPVDAAQYRETRDRMMGFAKKAAEDQQKQPANGNERNPPHDVGPNLTIAPAKTPSARSPQ
jgi:invasion protein IalB